MTSLKLIPLDRQHQELIIANAKKQAEPFIKIMQKIAFEIEVSLSKAADGKMKIVYSYEVDPYYILAKQEVERIFEKAQAIINKGK